MGTCRCITAVKSTTLSGLTVAQQLYGLLDGEEILASALVAFFSFEGLAAGDFGNQLLVRGKRPLRLANVILVISNVGHEVSLSEQNSDTFLHHFEFFGFDQTIEIRVALCENLWQELVKLLSSSLHELHEECFVV